MLWHYSCTEELCPHFVLKNGFGVPKTIGITALFRFCGVMGQSPFRSFRWLTVKIVIPIKQEFY